MNTRWWGKIGIPLSISLLLIAAAIKIWVNEAIDLVVGVFLGAGLVILGMSIFELFYTQTDDGVHHKE